MKQVRKIGPGEAQTRRRKRRQIYFYGTVLVLGFALGIVLANVERGQGNFVSGDIANLSLEPWVALTLAGMMLVMLLLVPLWWSSQFDELLREQNLIAMAGGCAAVLCGYPVWMLLYAGGFAELPHALGVYLIAFFGLAASFAYAKIRT